MFFESLTAELLSEIFQTQPAGKSALWTIFPGFKKHHIFSDVKIQVYTVKDAYEKSK